MDPLAFTHPELVRRWMMFVGDCWERSWNPVVTSASRSYETQLAWYRLDQQGLWPTGPVANPDQVWGPSPWGWVAYGSLHMVQHDGWSHAIDVTIQGATYEQYAPVAFERGLRFPEPKEHWHIQWWGLDGIYPVTKENDMTPEQLGLIRDPDHPEVDVWGLMLLETLDIATNEATYKWYRFDQAIENLHAEGKIWRLTHQGGV